MPNEEVLRCRAGGVTCEVSREVTELVSSLVTECLGVDAAELLGVGAVMLCRGEFSEAYLLRPELLSVVAKLMRSGRVPYSAGLYLGRVRVRPPRFIPSTCFLQFVYSVLGVRSALVISDEGLKPFLYGKDVLRASVVRCYGPIGEGCVVGVLGTDGNVYGVGLSEISSCSELRGLRPTDVVARNVFDVGWFLRGGTVPRERRFKV